jgi:hypothetical protein
MPVVDLVAALTQEIADHVLARTFGAAGRGYSDKILRGCELRVKTGIDGVEDFALRISHHAAAPVESGSREPVP